MQNKISKILKYINENYDIVATIQPRFLYKYNVYLKTEKYDLNIGIDIVDEDNFLYGENDYLLSFDFNANKKVSSRTLLSWRWLYDCLFR